MYIGEERPENRRLVHAIVTVDGQPFRANLHSDIDQFWRLRMDPFVRGPEADKARHRFRAVLDQDGWDTLLDSKRRIEAAIRKTGSSWSGWEAEGNDAGGGRQVGALEQDKPHSKHLITLVEGAGISVGAGIALSAWLILKDGPIRSFVVGLGGSVAGSAIYALIHRRASETP